MFCSKCGTAVTEGAAFCSACGQPVSSIAAAPPPAAPAAIPAAMPPVQAGWTAQPPIGYAGFWLRFVAFIIDSFLVGIPVLFAIIFLAMAMGLSAALQSVQPGESFDEVIALVGIGFIFAIVFVSLGVSWLYYAISESSSWQATLGKKALGLYVTDLQGRRISFGRASGRFFGKILSGHLTIYIGFIMAGLTAKKQALHDLIAGCLVLRRL